MYEKLENRRPNGSDSIVRNSSSYYMYVLSLHDKTVHKSVTTSDLHGATCTFHFLILICFPLQIKHFSRSVTKTRSLNLRNLKVAPELVEVTIYVCY